MYERACARAKRLANTFCCCAAAGSPPAAAGPPNTLPASACLRTTSRFFHASTHEPASAAQTPSSQGSAKTVDAAPTGGRCMTGRCQTILAKWVEGLRAPRVAREGEEGTGRCLAPTRRAVWRAGSVACNPHSPIAPSRSRARIGTHPARLGHVADSVTLPERGGERCAAVRTRAAVHPTALLLRRRSRGTCRSAEESIATQKPLWVRRTLHDGLGVMHNATSHPLHHPPHRRSYRTSRAQTLKSPCRALTGWIQQVRARVQS
jgi:hypothetical protein